VRFKPIECGPDAVAEDLVQWYVSGRGYAHSRRVRTLFMKRLPHVTVDEFLSGFDSRVRRLAEAARKRILSAVPHANERVRLGWRLIGYNAPAYFAFVSIEREQVRIGFEWGVLLEDSSGLLEGTGTQVRYFPVRSASDLRLPELTSMLRSAAALVPPPRQRRASR
jgi:hypothetical protein